jgi:aryl-alcohol dehydrogenase-like predicted oxidoreductase
MSLIREIRLPNGRLTKNLGFGCAGILRLPTNRQRERLVHTALEEGITHFDVARMYGAGAAEGILGTCLQGRRDQVTLATKFGFPCGVPSPRAVLKQSAARWVANLHPGLKKFLKRKAAPSGDRHYDYSVKEMEASLATSLAQLHTDRLDLFFLHEPRQADLVPEDIGDALRRQQESGRIGAFGLSALPGDLAHFFRKRPELAGQAVQFPMAWADDLPLPPAIVYTGVFHVLAGPVPALADYLAREREFARAWSEKLDLDLSARDDLALALLAVSLHARPTGMTLFFTSKPARLSRLVRALATRAFSPEALTEFRRELSQRLSPSHAA